MDTNETQTPASLTAEQVDGMKYNDLKTKAAELGLDASGSKEVLVRRIKGKLGLTTTAPAANDGDQSQPPAPAPAAPAAPTPPAPPQESTPAPAAPAAPLTEAQELAEDRKAEQGLRNDARAMKAALDKQPKVSIMIPFEAGENPEQGKQVPFHINLNGYKMDLPRGQYIEVPQQVADVIRERLESEGKIGAQWRIDRDSRKVEALS